MKRFSNLIHKCIGVLCMCAMLVAVHSVNVTCLGKFYQPQAPKKLDKFRKFSK